MCLKVLHSVNLIVSRLLHGFESMGEAEKIPAYRERLVELTRDGRVEQVGV